MLNFNQLKKNLKKDFSGLKKIRLALLADHASQFTGQALKGYGYEAGINFDMYESAYDQVDRQGLDTSSGLYQFEPEFIFINKSTEHLLKAFNRLNRPEQAVFSDKMMQEMKNYCDVISSK